MFHLPVKLVLLTQCGVEEWHQPSGITGREFYKETSWMSKNDLRIDKPPKGVCTDANHLHLQMYAQKRGWNYSANGSPQLPALCLKMLDL